MKKILYIILFLIFSQSVFGHGENLYRLSIHLPYSYDFKNSINNYGVDVNGYVVWLNFGTEYKFGEYIDQNKNIVNGFIGVGLFNYVQVQYGYSTSKYSIIRLRTEWSLRDVGLTKVDGLSFKFSIDRVINSEKADWFVSFGLGYSIQDF